FDDYEDEDFQPSSEPIGSNKPVLEQTLKLQSPTDSEGENVEETEGASQSKAEGDVGGNETGGVIGDIGEGGSGGDKEDVGSGGATVGHIFPKPVPPRKRKSESSKAKKSPTKVKFVQTGVLPSSKGTIMDEFDLHITGGKSSRDSDPIYMDVPGSEKDGVDVGRRMKDNELGDALMVNQAQSNFLVSEVYQRWVDSELQRGKLAKRAADCGHGNVVEQLRSTQASLAAAGEDRDSYQKEIVILKEKLQLAEQAHETSKRKYIHSIEELEKLLEKTKEAAATLVKDKDAAQAGEKDALRLGEEMKAEVERLKSEKDGLFKEVESLFGLKQFILSEGMELVSNHIRNCPQMKAAVAGVNNAMNGIGYNDGVRAGYAAASKGVPMNE
ncbi:hypothetical protein M8C21_028066, partial [Ambrosia artemisiifolia]